MVIQFLQLATQNTELCAKHVNGYVCDPLLPPYTKHYVVNHQFFVSYRLSFLPAQYPINFNWLGFLVGKSFCCHLDTSIFNVGFLLRSYYSF